MRITRKRRNAALLLTSPAMKTFTENPSFSLPRSVSLFPCAAHSTHSESPLSFFFVYPIRYCTHLLSTWTMYLRQREKNARVGTFFLLTLDRTLTLVRKEVKRIISRLSWKKNGFEALFHCTWTTWSGQIWSLVHVSRSSANSEKVSSTTYQRPYQKFARTVDRR